MKKLQALAVPGFIMTIMWMCNNATTKIPVIEGDVEMVFYEYYDKPEFGTPIVLQSPRYTTDSTVSQCDKVEAFRHYGFVDLESRQGKFECK